MSRGFFGSSIGKKAAMAVSGVFLFAFVIVHMLGNLQIFLGREALNDYAKHLSDLPYLLWPARVFLLSMLVVHIFFAARLTAENRRARPIAYAAKNYVQASYASRTMMMSGIIVFLFIVYHLLHFTFGVTNPEYFEVTDGLGRHDVYSMVVRSYQNLWISLTYIAAMAFLCLHLSHGASSFFQSLGLNDERLRRRYERFGKIAALAIFVGNSSIPLAVLAGFLRLPGGI